MTFKDLFSQHAPDYARFRPTYPPALFVWLADQVARRKLAVDVGSGNGQAATELATHFEDVIGLDPSETQLANATPTRRVEYRRGSAEATGLDSVSADLLVAAQAFHWFKQESFFTEVGRVVRPGGCLAVWCYGLSSITPEIDAVVEEVYQEYLGPYWEPERRLVEDGYRSVSFPFAELRVPAFQMNLAWTFEQLVGYIRTWSALKRYIKDRGEDPMVLVLPKLEKAWGAMAERSVSWPLAIRAFRL